MTQSLVDTFENRRIRSIAQDYRDRGYDVVLQPGKTDLPSFLSGFKVDIYAYNGEEHVILEVKTRTSLSKSKDLVRLAEAIQDRPGWRLELIVTNPRKEWLRDEEAVQLLNDREIEGLFQQVEMLLHQEQFVAAMLLAWTAMEATLRLIAKRNEVKLKEASSSYLIKQLLSVGILDRNQYDRLDEAIRYRNTIVHGFRIDHIQPEVIRNLIDTARHLLRSEALQHM